MMITALQKTAAANGKAYKTEDARWNAIVRRDAGADGAFYYSVKTTGVYCRPSCGARRALRANVAFYDSCEDAERAGFRACKRCRPRDPALSARYAAKVAAACRAIETAGEAPTLDALARAASMSRYHFHRVFARFTGLTPRAYFQARRADRMRHALARSASVTEAIYEAGFNSCSRFYAKSSQMLGMKPKHFRQGGTGEIIRFAVGECSLGAILVAASEKGVCAISLGNDPDQLARELQERFRRARFIGGDKKFESMVARVIGLVEAPGTALDLPLDLRGTLFQRRVWQALQEIPAGSTASYTEIAGQLGLPRAVRAVAAACAANPIALAIPCHRVLRRDGELSGYRWGVARKRTLLKREAGR